MGVNVEQLSAALRIGDGVVATPEPIHSILTRLLGVAEAFVELRAPGCPTAVADESVIRMAAYLYDQPTAGAEGRYSDAWRNSGASALVARWVVQRLGDATAEAVGVAGSGLTADEEDLLALKAELREEFRAADKAQAAAAPSGGADTSW